METGRFYFKFIMFFLVINVLAILFCTGSGNKIYGTKHVLWQLSAHYPITAEQLFYELNII